MKSSFEDREPRIEVGETKPTSRQVTGAAFPEISGNYRFAAIVSTQAHTPPGLARRSVPNTGNALRCAQWRSTAHNCAQEFAVEQTKPRFSTRASHLPTAPAMQTLAHAAYNTPMPDDTATASHPIAFPKLDAADLAALAPLASCSE